MDKAKEALPKYERVIFNNSALALCIVQLKYPPIQRFSDEKYMVGIKEALADEYPLESTEQGMNIVISPQGVNQTPGSSMLRFTSIDSRWSVILSNETVSLETREYSHIDELTMRFASILENVASHLRPRHQLRIGLRFINEFRFPDGDRYETWGRLLNADLIGLGFGGVLGGEIEQTIGEILTRRDDGRVLVRHGFLKGSTISSTPTHPAKIGPFYLLDLDYSDETPTKFEVDAPIERMKQYNKFLYNVFRWSIGNGELYQRLRG